MDTITKTAQTNVSTNREKTNAQSAFWKNAEENRLGITPILLVIMSCIGGFAAATGILENWVELAAVTFSATICLAMILSGTTMRAIIASTFIAVAADILVIAF